MSLFHLLVSHYAEPNEKRRNEYLYCLRSNLSNPFIERVHVFLEDVLWIEDDIDNHPNAQFVGLAQRVCYSHFLDYATKYLSNCPCIVANADIEFDETLGALAGYDLKDKFICLSRQDKVRAWSQDAWIFLPPLPKIEAHFPLGHMRCDNRIAYEASQAGLVLLNPAFTVHAIHHHSSGVRNYDENALMPGGVQHVRPVALPIHNLGDPL